MRFLASLGNPVAREKIPAITHTSYATDNQPLRESIAVLRVQPTILFGQATERNGLKKTVELPGKAVVIEVVERGFPVERAGGGLPYSRRNNQILVRRVLYSRVVSQK